MKSQLPLTTSKLIIYIKTNGPTLPTKVSMDWLINPFRKHSHAAFCLLPIPWLAPCQLSLQII
jgi:hypothetical protein